MQVKETLITDIAGTDILIFQGTKSRLRSLPVHCPQTGMDPGIFKQEADSHDVGKWG